MPGGTRTDLASRVIRATRQAIYRAFADPAALIVWMPPKGMRARLEHFDLRAGGGYRMILTYEDPAAQGKATADSDIVEVRFTEIRPNERIVQQVEFESDDPAFAGVMTMTWQLVTVSEGTEVIIRCDNVPSGIGKDDHAAGLRSTLTNLAVFTEG
ncbi:ATPase [Bosea caraganae]|uniref:ATPase n=1 Tax=Bosea caraganae TaxID=2763117 RepID=A0A370L8Q3_9HYPH|nr:SRPBCC family protein [Bosea caraganae]RDJ26763.1 ATPase [Bosea caraganae]RDJ30650.1 ATPase [Bosea caraganae]